MKKTSKEIETKICELYISGITNKELAEKFNINRSVVQSILKRNGIVLRKQTDTARKTKLLHFNNGILTNNDAYILGLIYSDGNLTKNNIEISLNEDDKQILSDISNYVYGFEKLSYRPSRTFKRDGKTYQSRAQYRLLISSLDVATKLREIGLCQNKSLVVRYPKINEIYHKHFIRGVFDGDGCIFISNKYKNTNRVTIIANEMFCFDLKLIIEQNVNIQVKINNKTNNVKTLSITGNKQIKKFMSWIYSEADLKLNRKFTKFFNEYNNV